jgi:hypothetical protein
MGRWLGVVALVALAACNDRPARRSPGARSARLGTVSPKAAAPIVASSAPSTSAAPPLASADATAVHSSSAVRAPAPRPSGDACRVTRGPIQLTLTGPVTLLPGEPGGDPRILFNRDGYPRAATLPPPRKVDPPKGPAPAASASAKPAPPERLALTEPAERASPSGCAAAGGAVYCVDRAGAVRRSLPSGEGSTVVAQARVGSPVAAASFGDGHVVYAFLADRTTTEGATTLAFAAVDDGVPLTLSEDGSGATFVSLATRGEEVLAMYIDARRVLTPVHARVLTYAGKLSLGPDAVVFVGSGTDSRIAGAIARGSSGHDLVLLPIDRDERTHGLAAIRVEQQPHDDAPTTWSPSPAAPERGAVAATQGAWPIRVLRVRPVDAQPKAQVMLELGEVDAGGAWKGLCPVAQGKTFRDLSMVVDGAGALWIAYTDSDGTWIERRQ